MEPLRIYSRERIAKNLRRSSLAGWIALLALIVFGGGFGYLMLLEGSLEVSEATIASHGLLVKAALYGSVVLFVCGGYWAHVGLQYGAERDADVLAKVCIARKASEEADKFMREIEAQGRHITGGEARELLECYDSVCREYITACMTKA